MPCSFLPKGGNGDSMIDKVKAVATESSQRTTSSVASKSAVRSSAHTTTFREFLSQFDAQAIATALQSRSIVPRNTSSSIRSASPTYTVRSGDTLYQICADTLTREGSSPSGAEISNAVQAVAKTNSLKNANRIYAGQTLDLAVLCGTASPSKPTSRTQTALVSLSPRGGPAATSTAQTSPTLAEKIVALLDTVTTASDSTSKATVPPIVTTSGYISSGYGYRKDPFTGRRELHNGIDIVAPRGTAVKPLKSGTVTFSGWQAGYGRIVIIQHEDNQETVYAHNSRNLVKVGQQVDTQTTIAKVGSSGRSSGPHVHFEVRKDGRSVNPASYIEASLKVAKAL